MVKNCKRHGKNMPMLPAVIDFHSLKVLIGYYCVSCHNFVPENNPEIEIYKKVLLESQEGQV